MTDYLSPAASKQKKRDLERLERNLRRWGGALSEWKVRNFMPNHPCHHTKTDVSFRQQFSTLHSKEQCSGYNRIWTSVYDNAAIYLKERFGWSDPFTQAVNFSSGASAGAFRKHDWYSLVSDFNEACDSLIPSSSLLGESIVEHEIFFDAFRILMNPSNALKVFFRRIKELKLEKKNLGTIAKIAKGTSNSFLSYNFGVKPAIEEVVKVATAHQVVQQRLKFLSNNGGSYVPIRIRQQYASPLMNPAPPTSFPISGFTTLRKDYTLRRSTAVIGAWGKVREDLNWNDVWQAYVQYFGINKVVGLAWELIPFSFVVDWFTNAQEIVNDLTRFRIAEPFSEIRNLCCSTKEETWSELSLVPGWDSAVGAYIVKPDGLLRLAEIRTTEYSRSLTIPDTSGVVDFSNLGLFHVLASGALLVQRVVR